MTTNLRTFFYRGFSRKNQQILVQEYLSTFLRPSNIKHTYTKVGKKSKVTTKIIQAFTNRSNVIIV